MKDDLQKKDRAVTLPFTSAKNYFRPIRERAPVVSLFKWKHASRMASFYSAVAPPAQGGGSDPQSAFADALARARQV